MKNISIEELREAGIPCCVAAQRPVKVVPKRRLFTVGAICAGAAAALVAGFFLLKKKDITIKLCCEMSNHDGDGEHCCYPREGMEDEPKKEACEGTPAEGAPCEGAPCEGAPAGDTSEEHCPCENASEDAQA